MPQQFEIWIEWDNIAYSGENDHLIRSMPIRDFGRGQEHLSTTLLTLNLLAFLLHTIAQVADLVYQQVRQALGTRRTFFNDVEALMRCLIFPDWRSVLRFMFVQLELEPD